MAGPAAIPASAEEVHARIDQLAGELAGAPEGSGNNEATRIGFMVGGYVGAGQIPFDQACGRLEAALATWTWRDDTSRTGVHMSLQRALDDGAKAPRPWTAAQPATKAKVKKPPPAPGTPGSYFTDSGGLLVATLAGAIRAKHPCALTQEHKVAVYTGGVYRLDGMAPSAAVAELLQDRFSPKHRASVTEFIAGTLYNEDRILPVHVTAPILNLRNGMLDLTTGILSHTTRTTCQQPSCPSPGILTRPAQATSTG